MKVAFISPHSDITAFGIRSISAYVKKHGHDSRMIFLPDPQEEKIFAEGGEYQYPDHILNKTLELCADADLIGISLFSMHFERSAQLTKVLKEKLSTPVVWGGIHATIRPDSCLEYADLACVGEGEEAVLDLLNRMERKEDYKNVPNMHVKANGNIIKNPARTLIQDLNTIPYQDMDMDDDYVIDPRTRRIEPMDKQKLREILDPGSAAIRRVAVPYQTMTSRGCPHNCTYCCNNTYRNMYKGQRYLRRRSAENIIGELTKVKEKFDFINFMVLSDDSFLAAPLKEIEEFARLYKERIKLPFSCLGDPNTIKEEKLAVLVDAGLIELQMGIESANPNTLKLYKRKISPEKSMRAAKVINKFKDKLVPYYDFIIDNPFETDDDLQESLDFIVRMPKPYKIQAFSLVLYTGTDLYEMAGEKGLLPKSYNGSNHAPNKQFFMKKTNYLNMLFSLVNFNLPHSLIWFMSRKPLVKLFNRSPFNEVISVLWMARKKMKHRKT